METIYAIVFSFLFSAILIALFTKLIVKKTPTSRKKDADDAMSQSSEIKPKKINILKDKKWEAVAKDLSSKSIHMKSSIESKSKHDKHIDKSVQGILNLQKVDI